jgi:hypothetical protein
VKASVGDRIIIEGHREGEPLRDGEIMEVRSEDGSPPYVVEWSDNGHSSLFYPGPDAKVQRFQHRDPHGTGLPQA